MLNQGVMQCRNRGVLAVAVVGLLVGMVHWFADPQRREAHEMPAAERRALYLHVIRGMEAFCRLEAAAPEKWCRAQADLLFDLPECDQACNKLADRYREHATR